MIDLLREREELMQKHPELREFQEKLEMNFLGKTDQAKLEMLTEMMHSNLREIQTELEKLSKRLKGLINE